jgi:hypothetical protein
MIINHSVSYIAIDKPVSRMDLQGVSVTNRILAKKEMDEFLCKEISPFILNDYREHLNLQKAGFLRLFKHCPTLCEEFGGYPSIKYRLILTKIFNPLIYILRLIKRLSQK